MAGQLPSAIPSTAAELKALEALNAVCDLYIWLAFRFEEAFPDRIEVENMRLQCSDMIGRSLENLGRQKRRATAKAGQNNALRTMQPFAS